MIFFTTLVWTGDRCTVSSNPPSLPNSLPSKTKQKHTHTHKTDTHTHTPETKNNKQTKPQLKTNKQTNEHPKTLFIAAELYKLCLP